LLSGCADPDYSADAFIEGKAQGAMTYSLLSTIKASAGKPITLISLLKKLRIFMKNNGYAQVPQMSTGKLVNLQSYFSVV
jgi:hypothetical protein